MSEDTQPRLVVSHSPTLGAIAKALAAAQLEMGPAIKDKIGRIPGKDGKQGYEYTYATLATCFEAILPLHKNGIAVTQIPLDGGNGVLVATLLIHESGEWVRGELWMPVGQSTPQGYGSALTYCRRYSLQLLCGLASEDDDGADASQGAPQKAPARQAPAKAPPKAPDLKLFASFCDRVDAAEAPVAMNDIASGAKRAHQDGAINDQQYEQIKAAVTKKRGLLGQSVTNGGAA